MPLRRLVAHNALPLLVLLLVLPLVLPTNGAMPWLGVCAFC